MRMNTDVAVIERSGVTEETQFGIQFNAKMARILSKQIYSNVIQAPIREIICNAWDSHRAANKLSTPIRVHLPNQMEPWFEVQDSGVGLSADAMKVLYTQYGASTKADSNDDIGGLGLGCKAPFAYTDAFTVTSVHDGVRRSYSLFKNEQGIPAMVFMGEAPCADSNGVTVRVPVKNQDFDRFRSEAQQVLRWFDTPMEVTGNSQYKKPEFKVLDLIRGEHWYLVEADYYNRSSSMAVMGNVAYPIQADQIARRYHGLITAHYTRIIMHFQIGELDISPTREELSYDPMTIKVLEQRLEQVLRECVAHVQDKLQTCDTEWAARCAWHNLTRTSGLQSLAGVLTSAGLNLMWRGKKDVGQTTIGWDNMPGVDKNNPSARILDLTHTQRGHAVNYVEASDRAQFVDADCADAGPRVRKHFENKNKKVYLIKGTPEQRVAMWQYLGQPPLVKASDLERVERKTMKFKGNKFKNYSGWGRRSRSDNWDSESELTLDQGGFYVTQVHWQGQTMEGALVPLTHMVNLAQKMGILDAKTPVWGLNKTNTKLVQANKKWTQFDTWFREQVSAQLSDKNILLNVAHMKEIHQITDALNLNMKDLVLLMTKHWSSEKTELGMLAKEFINAAQHVKKDEDKIGGLQQAATLLGLHMPMITKPSDLGKIYAQCMTQYPLMRWLKHMKDTTIWNQVTEYVRAMHMMNQQTMTK